MLTKAVKNSQVTVYTEDRRTFITVPSKNVDSLRCYLRNKGLPTGHAETVTPGIMSVELSARVDVKAVQLLLKVWRETL